MNIDIYQVWVMQSFDEWADERLRCTVSQSESKLGEEIVVSADIPGIGTRVVQRYIFDAKIVDKRTWEEETKASIQKACYELMDTSVRGLYDLDTLRNSFWKRLGFLFSGK